MNLGWSQETKPSQKDVPQKQKNITTEEEEEGPLLLKFEPSFEQTEAQKRQAMLDRKSIIDTLSVSDRKRQRLMLELYKGEDRLFKKTMLATVKFEDDPE